MNVTVFRSNNAGREMKLGEKTKLINWVAETAGTDII